MHRCSTYSCPRRGNGARTMAAINDRSRNAQTPTAEAAGGWKAKSCWPTGSLSANRTGLKNAIAFIRRAPARLQADKGKGESYTAAEQRSGDKPDQSRTKDITGEIAAIALPTLVALAADPLAGLVDTAFIGNLGATELAGTGVSLSLFTTITRLVNAPLLAVATTSTAAALGRTGDERSEEVSQASTAVLVIAGIVGVAEVLLLSAGGQSGLELWGLPAGSDVFDEAAGFLQIRAAGAPATILLLVSQGVFRGLGDSTVPLRATLLANIINLALDPLLIFKFGLGVKGAAYATVIGEGLAGVYLVSQLADRCSLQFSDASRALAATGDYLKPTGLLIVRTVALSGTFALATSVAARLGVDATATHEICFQIWLSSSILADGLAVAAQSLLGRAFAAGDSQEAAQVVKRSLQLATALGIGLGGSLALAEGPLLRLFSSDADVAAAAAFLFPAVILTQPLNSLAFVWDGILLGVGGFRFAASVMPLCVAPSMGVLWIALSDTEASTEHRLVLIWTALGLLMAARAAGTWIPYRLGTGPFTEMRKLLDADDGGSTSKGQQP